MTLITLALYLLACGLCGAFGRRTTFGFVGHFLIALLLSPLVDFIILLVARPRA